MIGETGVLKDSERYYYEPDPFTAEHLFYSPHGGAYHCDKDYSLSRNSLDVNQIILVDSGTLTVEYEGETKTAHSGMIVLLDRRKPHSYFAGGDDLRMRWFHFTGNTSHAYTDLLLDQQGFVISSADLIPEIEHCCERILMLYGNAEPSPHVASVYLHRLLAILAITSKEKKKSELELSIEKTAEYMKGHLEEKDISLEVLAEMAGLSHYYYLRKFKEIYGLTPHKYLLTQRLRSSKELLTTTSLSIEEIGLTCGFSNPSHFIMAFRKNTDMTPFQYRNFWR